MPTLVFRALKTSFISILRGFDFHDCLTLVVEKPDLGRFRYIEYFASRPLENSGVVVLFYVAVPMYIQGKGTEWSGRWAPASDASRLGFFCGVDYGFSQMKNCMTRELE